MLSVVSRIVSMSGQIEAAHGRPDRRAACSFLVALVAPYPISLINNIPSYNLILAGDDRQSDLARQFRRTCYMQARTRGQGQLAKDPPRDTCRGSRAPPYCSLGDVHVGEHLVIEGHAVYHPPRE